LCGRYVLFSSAKQLADEFELTSFPEFDPRYNIAPSQEVFAIRLVDSGETSAKRELVLLRWGLIPSWTHNNPSDLQSIINARCETISSKPSFRSSFRKRRILIPSNGFYEWKKCDSGYRQPFLIHLENFELLAFAGIFDQWKTPSGEIIKTCSIVTTRSNNSIKSIHDRMPVILRKPDYAAWLKNADDEEEELKDIFEPLGDDLLTITPVSSMVNNPRNEGPDCMKPSKTTDSCANHSIQQSLDFT
jgi:putative SOS response-associated peptidase YedK